MKYDSASATAFTLKIDNEEGQSVYQEYQIPDQLTNWQMSEIAGITGDVFISCGEFARMLLSSAQAIMTTAKDTEDVKGKIIEFVAKLLDDPLQFNFLKGAGELLVYAHKNKLFAKLTSVLFLKPGESSIGDNDLKLRIALMESVPLSQLKGITSFFQKKTTSSKNLKLPLTTLETKKKKSTP